MAYVTAGTQESRVTPYGAWALRLALLSGGLVLSAILFHRFFGMATPVAMNLLALALVGAIVSLGLVATAVMSIWKKGVRGKFVSTLAFLVSAAVVAWPLSYLPAYLELPEINDVSTDITVPPRFVELAKLRSPDANSVAFSKDKAERLQAPAYPDVRAITVNRSSEEAYELAIDALRRQGLQVVSEVSPRARSGQPGWVEARDRTLIMGFQDDVVIRIAGDARRARIDVRSASRYGRHDLGRNVERVRRILKEFHGRLEATVATADERGGGLRRRDRRNLNALKARSQIRKSKAKR